MKVFLPLFILVSFISIGQDTLILGDPKVDTSENSFLQVPSIDLIGIDCAHGHMCCAVGCGCCQELKRPQIYDTAVYKVTEDIFRYEIHERYFYAAFHAPSAVQYIFKNKEGEIISSFFSVNNSRIYLGDYHSYKYKTESKLQTEFEKPQVAVFDHNKRYFILNKKGEVLRPKYHSKEALTPELYRVSIFIGQKRIFGFVDADGEELGKGLSYSSIDEQNTDGTFVCLEDRYGYSLVNEEGSEIIKTDHGSIKYLKPSLYSVQSAEGFALFNKEGERISDFYEGFGAFSDEAISVRKDNKIGFISSYGEEIIKPKYEWAYPFNNGLSAVIKNKKWGFIDKTGELIIDYEYDQVKSFNENRAVVAIGTNSNEDKWGVIDKKGEYIVKPFYDELSGYKGGLCKTNINGSGYGFIDLKGKEKVLPNYFVETYGDEKSWFRFDVGVLKTVGKKGRLFLVDKEGKEILDLSKYYSANYVQVTNKLKWLPYLIVYAKEGKRGMIDFEGRELITSEWDEIYVLNDQMALLNKGEQWFLLNYKSNEKKRLMEGNLSQMPSHDVVILENEEKEKFYFDINGEQFSPY